MPSALRRRPSTSLHSTARARPADAKLLPLAAGGFLVFIALSSFTTLAAGQRAPAPTPSPAAPQSPSETPAPRGGGGDGGWAGGGGDDDDDGDLSEICEADGSSADYSEVLTGTGDSMERHVSTSTGCPNHVNWNIVPNEARVNPTNTTIPAYPVFIDDGGTTSLAVDTPGSVGILLNGVAVFSSWAAAEASISYETSAFFTEAGTFDACGGHATQVGIYHFHNTPGCLQEHAMVVTGATRQEHSPQLGWAYDGFPVYGQLGPGGVEMKLCGQQGADSVHCLDLCSGYEAEVPGVDGFKYRYYLSCGFDESFFPFVTNCYRGCCPPGMECGRYVEACTGAESEVGYVEGEYTPVASASLADPYDTDLLSGVDTEYVDGEVVLECSAFVGSESEGYGLTGAPSSAPSSAPTAAATVGGSSGAPASADGSATPSPAAATVGSSTPAPSAAAGAPAAGIVVPATPSPASGSAGAGADASGGAPPTMVSSSCFILSLAAAGAATFVAGMAFGMLKGRVGRESDQWWLQRAGGEGRTKEVCAVRAHPKRTGGRGRNRPTTSSVKAGLQFPVGRIGRFLKRGQYADRVGAGAPVYLAAVIEYLVAEVLELAGNQARDDKKARITPRHIQLAVRNDHELSNLLGDEVTIPSGGVLPHVTVFLSRAKKMPNNT
eukprot:g3404.t1